MRAWHKTLKRSSSGLMLSETAKTFHGCFSVFVLLLLFQLCGHHNPTVLQCYETVLCETRLVQLTINNDRDKYPDATNAEKVVDDALVGLSVTYVLYKQCSLCTVYYRVVLSQKCLYRIIPFAQVDRRITPNSRSDFICKWLGRKLHLGVACIVNTIGAPSFDLCAIADALYMQCWCMHVFFLTGWISPIASMVLEND